MNIEELIRDLRARINPQYYDQIGTESYERQQCVVAIESLLARNDVLREENKMLRDEVNGLTGSLDRAESVLQNLMSYLSVNGCRTEIDPENAELRIRDGINMLVRPAMERAEKAEAALKEAQDQPAVAWLIHEYQGTGDKRIQFNPHVPSIRDEVVCPIVTELYTHPVPAPAVSDANPVQWLEDEGDMILVPRGLLGAACSSIDKQRPAPKVLKAMRHYTMNAQQAPAAPAPDGDDFNGTTPHMIQCIEALVSMNDRGVLIPHGIGSHARTLLLASANRLRQQVMPVPEEWREVMAELADDLAIELDMRYQSRNQYPSEQRKYDNEMVLVKRARALLQSDEVQK